MRIKLSESKAELPHSVSECVLCIALRFRCTYFDWPKKLSTVKPVYNDHPRDPKNRSVIDRWSLFRGTFTQETWKTGPRISGPCWQVGAIPRWSLALV